MKIAMTMLILAGVLATEPIVALADDAAISIAKTAARALAAGQVDAVIANMAPEVTRALPASQLAALWPSLVQRFGAFKGFGAPGSEQKTSFDAVTIPATFERKIIDLKLSVSAGKIAGLFIVPHQVSISEWQRPDYVVPNAFREIELTIGQVPTALPATLALPTKSGLFPAIVLVHGSGPGDRDESVGPNRPFRDLAQGLASRGIAVLRYEKRTKSYPETLAKLAAPTVKNETIDDVDAAVELLRARPDIDPSNIVVLGHSLGGTLAPRIAAENPSVSAIVILAGTTRPLPDIMVEQITFLANLGDSPAETKRQSIAAARAEADRALAARPDDFGAPIFGIPPSYWGDLNAYDPAKTAAKLTIPILILQGDRDYQVSLSDFDRFRESLDGHKNVELRMLHGLNHLFAAGTAPSNPSDYDIPGHVDPSVIDLIARFVDRIQEARQKLMP